MGNIWETSFFKNISKTIEQSDKSQFFHEKSKSKIYRRPKAEKNIAKVKEENLFDEFKDKCDKNFIKKSYQSQKRKRKEDAILNDVIEKPNTIPDHVENKSFEEIQKNYIQILD